MARHAVPFVLLVAAALVVVPATAATADLIVHGHTTAAAAGGRDPCPEGTLEECLAGEYNDGDVGGGAGVGLRRRRLFQRMDEDDAAAGDYGAGTPPQYISYAALMRNSVPCSVPGASYYNCRPGADANPYTRGCSAITQCRD